MIARARLSDERVDWFRVIVDLGKFGYPASVVALSIDAPKTTVKAWKYGSRPRYEEGERLICLWSKVTGNSRDFVPRVNRYSHLS